MRLEGKRYNVQGMQFLLDMELMIEKVGDLKLTYEMDNISKFREFC